MAAGPPRAMTAALGPVRWTTRTAAGLRKTTTAAGPDPNRRTARPGLVPRGPKRPLTLVGRLALVRCLAMVPRLVLVPRRRLAHGVLPAALTVAPPLKETRRQPLRCTVMHRECRPRIHFVRTSDHGCCRREQRRRRAARASGYRRSAGSPRGEARRRELLDRVADDLAVNGLVDFCSGERREPQAPRTRFQPPRPGRLGQPGSGDAARTRPAPRQAPPTRPVGRGGRQLYAHPLDQPARPSSYPEFTRGGA